MNQEPFNTPVVPEPASRWYKPWAWRLSPWASGLLSVGMVLVTAAIIWGCLSRATNYGNKIVGKKSESIPVGVVLKNTPPWLSAELLTLIRKEAESFAQRDDETFKRFKNPLDNDILREVADNFTAGDRVAASQNAWIRRVREVRRRIEPDRKAQWIEIYADYRKPVAVVAVPMDRSTGQRLTDWQKVKDPTRVPAMRYYLVDGDHIRLPGEYTENIFVSMRLLTLYGIDQDVPAPGAAWTAPELTAGLALARVLAAQPFASQIALINLSNYEGRAVDPQATDRTDAKITLLTPFGSQVWWGRPMGEEQTYEISPEGKIKALTQIFARFNRIDAGRDYVDIRYDQIKIPTTTRTASDAGDTAGAATRPHNG